MAESYAPRSPDLSAIHSYPPSNDHPYNQDPQHDFSKFAYNAQQPLVCNPPQQQAPLPYGYPQSSYDLPPPHLPQHADAAIKHEHLPSSAPKAISSQARSLKQAAVKHETKPRVPAPGELEGIVVKTKFPVARIKRIVQADEDVGKVAQVTPVVVAKALELFMISLTLRAGDIARTRGSKRVTASHLKQAVVADDQFDFLSEVVSKIPDAPTSKDQGAAGKAERKRSDSDDDDWDDEKPKRGGRKKRTKPTSDD